MSLVWSLAGGKQEVLLVTGGDSHYVCGMQKDSPLFEDLAKIGSAVAGSVMDMRRELEAMVAEKLERVISHGRFVPREEFEVVREMAQKAREENAVLRSELEAIKQR